MSCKDGAQELPVIQRDVLRIVIFAQDKGLKILIDWAEKASVLMVAPVGASSGCGVRQLRACH
jgi:hypothetical protein